MYFSSCQEAVVQSLESLGHIWEVQIQTESAILATSSIEETCILQNEWSKQLELCVIQKTVNLSPGSVSQICTDSLVTK